MESYYKGDTIELKYQLYKDKSLNECWNLTDNKIRFQINNKTVIKKATANVVGGSDEQIKIIDASKGIFLVIILKEESSALDVGTSDFEIQVDTAEGKRFTVLVDKLAIKKEIIIWEIIE